MSEKATLLTSIPSVSKSEPVSGASNRPAPSTKAPSVAAQKVVEGKPNLQQESAVTASTTQAVEAVAPDGKSITSFQATIYASFALTFCLAGFAAVVLFRKATKIAEARFVISAKALGMGAAVTALHCFFAAYLYANHLNGEATPLPLAFSMAVWLVLGPTVAIILNNLLATDKKPEKRGIIIDSVAYVVIFGCAMVAMAGIKENAALVFSLLAGFLLIVPIARSFSAFRIAKARHPELRETPDQILIYALLGIPCLLPIIAFAYVCKLDGYVTQFLINFITFDFILIAGFAMIAAAEEMEVEAPAVEAAAVKPVAQPAAAPKPVAAARPAPTASPAAVRQPKKLPPRPATAFGGGASIPAAPRKPGQASESAVAANAPSRVKAPAKPKKRF